MIYVVITGKAHAWPRRCVRSLAPARSTATVLEESYVDSWSAVVLTRRAMTHADRELYGVQTKMLGNQRRWMHPIITVRRR